MQTGYFANTKIGTKVHVVDENHIPVCGSIINDDKKFQRCAGGIKFDYIECEHCRTIIRKRLIK